MADDKVRDEQGMTEDESEGAESRRKLIKGAAALAAAAVGGGLVAGAADAQREVKPQLRTGAQLVQLQPTPLAKSLKVNQLAEPLANLPALNPELSKGNLQQVLGDIDRFVGPILDRNGGQVSDVNITVEGTITVSG